MKPSQPRLHEPFFHLVRDAGRRADHLQPAIATDELGELPHSQVLPPRECDQALPPALAGVRLGDFRQRASKLNLDASVPSRIDRFGIPLSGCTRLSSFAFLARASASVSPTMTSAPGRIFKWSGERPTFSIRPFTSV